MTCDTLLYKIPLKKRLSEIKRPLKCIVDQSMDAYKGELVNLKSQICESKKVSCFIDRICEAAIAGRVHKAASNLTLKSSNVCGSAVIRKKRGQADIECTTGAIIFI